jgi:hypothetical protein
MPVTTAMVLLVQVVAIFIIAAVMVHTHGGGMTMLQFGKNTTAVSVATLGIGMPKKLL